MVEKIAILMLSILIIDYGGSSSKGLNLVRENHGRTALLLQHSMFYCLMSVGGAMVWHVASCCIAAAQHYFSADLKYSLSDYKSM